MGLEKERLNKLNVFAKNYLYIRNMKNLSFKQIRRLQFLVKKHRHKQKQKLFGIINVYKEKHDIYLKVYCNELLLELEEIEAKSI